MSKLEFICNFKEIQLLEARYGSMPPKGWRQEDPCEFEAIWGLLHIKFYEARTSLQDFVTESLPKVGRGKRGGRENAQLLVL